MKKKMNDDGTPQLLPSWVLFSITMLLLVVAILATYSFNRLKSKYENQIHTKLPKK